MNTEKVKQKLLPILHIMEEHGEDIMNGNDHGPLPCGEEGCLLCETRGAIFEELNAEWVSQRLLEQYRASEEMQEGIPKELIDGLESSLR
jgi:hypothetical protein